MTSITEMCPKPTSTSYPKCLGPEVLQISGFFIFYLEYLPMCNETYWRWDQSLNTKFFLISHILYRHSLKIIRSTTFKVPALWEKSHNIRYGIFHLQCNRDIQRVSDIGTFWIEDIWTRNAQPAVWSIVPLSLQKDFLVWTVSVQDSPK